MNYFSCIKGLSNYFFKILMNNVRNLDYFRKITKFDIKDELLLSVELLWYSFVE